MGGQAKGGSVSGFLKRQVKGAIKSTTQHIESPFRVARELSKGNFEGALDEAIKPHAEKFEGNISSASQFIADITGQTALQEQIAAEKQAAFDDNQKAIKQAEQQRQTEIANRAAQRGPKIRLGGSSSLAISKNTGAVI